MSEPTLNLGQVAQACAGELINASETVAIVGVSTDSRSIARGELFVAISGEHFDGHDYVAASLARGACAALVRADWAQKHQEGLPLVAVAETRTALGALAAAWRAGFELPLIGVTGSNGKTTVKEMCAAILRAWTGAPACVLATEGNLNNDIGLPLMLLRLRARHKAAVIEMGMNHQGEIAHLTRIAQPTVAVITNAQRAHLAGLGSLTAVALAKGEIFAGLPPNGVAVINADDAHADLWRQLAGAHRLVDYSLERQAAVSGHYAAHGFGGRLDLATPEGRGEIQLQLPGRHNAANAVAAAAATLAAGADFAAVVAGLNACTGVKGRLQKVAGINGAMVIDDSYNANPDSLRAAIDVLASLPGKKILVLGDMGEVGAAAGQYHDEIGGYAKSMGIDLLLALGEHAATAAHNFAAGASHYKNVYALIEALRPLLDAQTTVLVKGSRFMKMERVVDAIAVVQPGTQE